ncbi:UDP-glucose 6-dehydrogenase, putative [Medicago truncatula]|uniref:UDP-glucose 6-dehydrogenase, putative n=1 Tax=Medicago truncatula TaxID=3880 RepID=G7KMP0_MEDTR|nr:UDP-glucose 6-dehydrogenase, putative [Medicago truncatula]
MLTKKSENHVYEAGIVFVSVNTMTKTCGLRADKARLEKSTLPVKTAETIEKKIST